MDIRRVVVGWVFYVAVATTVYGVFFNAKFAKGGELPAWLTVMSLVTAMTAFAILVWWLSRVAAGKVPEQKVRDYSGLLVVIVVTGIVGDLLAIAAEIAFGAPSLWMMIPISTITYCLFVVWIYRRYFKLNPTDE